MLPDTATLSERLRVCLQEGEENPRDFTTLFDLSIYQLDITSLTKVIKSVPVALCSECLVWKCEPQHGAAGHGQSGMQTCSQLCDEVGSESWGIARGRALAQGEWPPCS